MEAPVNRKNCSFEIAFDDSDPQISNRSPFTSTKPSKCSVEHGKAADEKMAEVIRRKSGILQQTREKYEAHNQKVKSVVEDIRAKRDNQIAELKENTEMRLEMASLRRRQTLDEKAESAKKMFDRVERVRASLSEEAERKMNDIAQDMANKENNRCIIIQGVKDFCQQEFEKVAKVQNRRASINKN
ncbi:expressed conserved protein [Echinococcus multilocularis]|uniref:Expressed conserved protein n=1 Tax=Echinococcus multilocularis TaxID=6211 RepID=A0A068YE89_ECHMU|nr:expressed conserved protein [Echinococcus multilocularis]